ncbi:glycoside hydrolase family 3 C-terminal domain-containing protein, partial [Microbacterium gubbeenense]|uniref:glycoside hydrolase family 3 C-terminal domain-containing protein n=1 Tax=Microbacterium gubbeenense TaxID=159896 RepID=UPI003F9D15EE
MADIKHYVGNEQELDRQTSSSNIDERTLRQAYDRPVEIAVAESDPASVMCSYNQINGVYGCENPILNTNLKGLMGFAGYVVSDFGAVHSTAAALNSGLDQELNAPKHFTPELLDKALAAGDITEQRVDEAAGRVISAYIEHGLFDTPLPETPVEDASTTEHTSIALEAAQQGSVLLKNDGLLPLDIDAGAEIAIIGATASSTPTEGVSASTICSMAWNDGNTLECEDLVSPEDAIRERAAEIGATVTFDAGTDPASAADVAASADIAIVFGYQKMGEFSDVADLSLQGGGDALIDAVSSANPRTAA